MARPQVVTVRWYPRLQEWRVYESTKDMKNGAEPWLVTRRARQAELEGRRLAREVRPAVLRVIDRQGEQTETIYE